MYLLLNIKILLLPTTSYNSESRLINYNSGLLIGPWCVVGADVQMWVELVFCRSSSGRCQPSSSTIDHLLLTVHYRLSILDCSLSTINTTQAKHLVSNIYISYTIYTHLPLLTLSILAVLNIGNNVRCR